MTRDEKLATLARCFKNNPHALDVVVKINDVCEIWDDLHDGDRAVSLEEMNGAFDTALLELPSNPFYRMHQDEYIVLMRSVRLAWHDSNVLSKGSEHDRHMAYMLKQQITRIANYTAYLIGGMEWAKRVGPDICRLYDQPLEEYMKETS